MDNTGMSEGAHVSTTDMLPTGSSQPDSLKDANTVCLRGRLAAVPVERGMPSGDTMVQFRLVVPRNCDAGRRDPRSPTVDTIDCVSWNPQALGGWIDWQAGELISVSGCLRRRFWRAGPSIASRYEVEVHTATHTPGCAQPVNSAQVSDERSADVDRRAEEGESVPSVVE